MSEWWRGAVTYQVYPRSFQDSNGDGVGDLPGLTRRLPYLAGLGVDAIWLSPFFKSPMKDMGYDVSDYCDVDPVFGTLADFDVLVAKAHDLGLKIIIDQVLSHTSDQHPAFATSRSSRDNPTADWYVWSDPLPDGSPPSNWLSVFGGSAWAWDARRKQYYLHNFLTSQPDLNFHNAQVQDWALDCLRFWLDRGVDGFRFDTVNYYFHDRGFRSNPADQRDKDVAEGNPYGMQVHLYDKNQPENLGWLVRIRKLLDEYGAASVGEIGEAHHAIRLMGQYTAPGRLHQCYSFELMGRDYTPALFRDRVEGFFAGAPKGWPMWAFSNHDVPRHLTRWAKPGDDQDALAKQTASLLLSLEGSICLWQGEELGQTDTTLGLEELTDPQGIAFWPEPVGRDNTRTPMVWDEGANGGFTDGTPWLPVKSEQAARHVAGQASQAGSVLEHYRAMLAFRHAEPALRQGRTRFLNLAETVLGFTRGKGAEAVLCLFNFAATEQKVPVSGAGGMIGPLQGGRLARGTLTLAPHAAVFLRGADQA